MLPVVELERQLLVLGKSPQRKREESSFLLGSLDGAGGWELGGNVQDGDSPSSHGISPAQVDEQVVGGSQEIRPETAPLRKRNVEARNAQEQLLREIVGLVWNPTREKTVNSREVPVDQLRARFAIPPLPRREELCVVGFVSVRHQLGRLSPSMVKAQSPRADGTEPRTGPVHLQSAAGGRASCKEPRHPGTNVSQVCSMGAIAWAKNSE